MAVKTDAWSCGLLVGLLLRRGECEMLIGEERDQVRFGVVKMPGL